MKIIRISAVWCPSCLIMRERYDTIEKQYPNIEFKAYDIDFDEEAASYNVGKILPVLILFNNDGLELERIIGEKKVAEITNIINKHIE